MAQENTLYRTSYIAKWGMDTASIETITIDGQHMYGKALHLYDHPNLKEFYIKFDGCHLSAGEGCFNGFPDNRIPVFCCGIRRIKAVFLVIGCCVGIVSGWQMYF